MGSEMCIRDRKRIEEIEKGVYEEEFNKLFKLSPEELKEIYVKREIKLD